MLPERLITLGYSLVVPCGLILTWQLACYFELASPSMLPWPAEAWTEAIRLFSDGSIVPDITMTGFRMAAGYFSAVLVGVLGGLIIGTFRPLYAIATPAMDFIRSTPVTILYPVFVLLFGVSHLSKIAMVFIGCVFVIMLNTAYGVMQSNRTRQQMAKMFGATPFQVFRWVLFFDALPQTMVGLRVSLSFALVVEILCEMFMGSEYGLGQRVTECFTTYAIAEMYSLILLVGMIGFLLNRGIVFLERRVVPWSIQEQR